MTCVPLTLDNACNLEYMHRFYSVQAAAAVTRDIDDFRPYADNFRIVDVFVDQRNGGAEHGTLVLQFVLPIDTTTRQQSGMVVRVSVSFPHDYPTAPLQVHLTQTSNSNHNDTTTLPLWRATACAFVASNGRVMVDQLPISPAAMQRQGVLLSLLLVLKNSLDELAARAASTTTTTSAAYSGGGGGGGGGRLPAAVAQPATGGYVHNNNASNTSSSSNHRRQEQRWAQDMATALAHDMVTMRDKAVQEAAERVVINVNEKAMSYLQTRRQALRYLRVLEPANEQLTQVKELLSSHKAELQRYLPPVGEVHALLAQVDGHTDTIDEHERCLVAEDALQARALELMADIHAAEDTLSLLEEGLRSEQLSCDDYVRCVSDVGRMLFVTRFLYHRVMEQMSRNSSSSAGGHRGGGGGGVVGGSGSSSGNSVSPTQNHHDGHVMTLESCNNSNSSNNGEGEATGTNVVQTSSITVPQRRLSPEEVLHAVFPSMDRGIILDVLASVNGDVKEARQQLHALAAQ